MALTKEVKQELIDKHGRASTDTGSPEVQVAMLTKRINDLTEHLRTHSKDHNSRRGLLKLVGRRRRFLTYMQKTDLEGYRALIKELTTTPHTRCATAPKSRTGAGAVRRTSHRREVGV